ncbi:MAG: flagellar hook-associated protein FlgL [Terriglobia bacterium]
MGLRIGPDLFSTMENAITADQQRLNTYLQQVSTGQSVNEPSDNPTATAAYIENKTESDSVDQFTQNISTVEESLQTAETALGSVVSNLSQALSIGTEAANGTNSTSELQGFAQQVQAIQQTVLSLANTSYQGNYLFAGTDTTTAPYIADLSSPSGVTYVGNTGTNNIDAGPGQSVTINKPGSSIFDASGSDVFQALSDLTTALQTNTNITGALSEVQSAFNTVNTQQTFYGNTLDQLNSINGNLTEEQTTLSTQASSLISANPAQAESNLVQEETALQAGLQAFGSISQDTLLNYLNLTVA